MNILEIIHLRKEYKNIVAVVDVSFSVTAGSCYGLLGPNGAGKTTTMEVIEGIQEATSGTILYQGKSRTPSFQQEIGIQFQHTSLLNFLSVEETLRTYQKLYHNESKIDWLIERCDLQPILGRRNNKLSGGQQQRLMLALALLNNPQLVFLDEPSTGLDPQSRRYLWEIIEDIKRDGKTVVMTTHSMEEAEHLCDRIAIMDKGEIIAEGSPVALIQSHCHENTITLPVKRIGNKLEGLELAITVNSDSATIKTSDVHETLELLIKEGIELHEMVVHSPNLEDVFLKLTGRKLRE
ncbi:MAG: ABC transporter ATP-binding protein [Desulfobulbaceae bacterium]|nr:MAG: ABC transporter ATP-binding protein [Desulfobulbaceae bacterium]